MYASRSRTLQTMLLVGLAVCVFAATARCQSYPQRVVTIIVPLAPGGGADFVTRLIADGLSNSALGQRFIVENRGGANGNLGNASVARSAPDGYTLLSAYSGFQVTNPAIYPKPGWDPIKDFAPIALIGRAPHVMAIRKDLPANNLTEFIAHAKRLNGQVTFASTGVGSISHLGGELLMHETGIKLVHVPYRGAGPAMNDLLGGNVDMSILTPAAAMGNIAAGTIKPIALLADKRHPMLSQVPTAAEQSVLGVDLTVWFALYAPAGTPPAIVDRLATELDRIVNTGAYRDRLLEQGLYADFLGPKALGDLTKHDLDHWAPIIRGANIKVE